MFLSSQNKLLRADPNYIKEMPINWESFVFVKDKKFNVEIRVFLMTCLLFSTFSSVSFSYNNYNRER